MTNSSQTTYWRYALLARNSAPEPAPLSLAARLSTVPASTAISTPFRNVARHASYCPVGSGAATSHCVIANLALETRERSRNDQDCVAGSGWFCAVEAGRPIDTSLPG